MTAALPEHGPMAMHSAQGHGLNAWVTTVDHKRIGILYLVTALFFFAVGGLEALVVRLQLARPSSSLVSAEAFNQLFTMHGTTMIFLVVMPTLVGFGNYFVPLMIGARDMAFPRLNAMSYWLFPWGAFLLHFSLLTGGAPSAGWFGYAPLSETPFSSTLGTDYWILALLVLGVGSVATALNFIATILTLRAPGMSLGRVPLFVWMTLVTSVLVVLALPVLNAALVLLMVDRRLEAHVFLASGGGNTLLWQHFFWTFGHPEVYILALPAFGMISEIIPVFSRKPIFGYGFVAASTVAIAILSFGVWAHHMFAAGLGHAADAFFAAGSMLIAVPTGVKIFNWIATMWGGSIRFTTAMLFATAFLIEFVIGGLSGVTFAAAPIDWQMTDTYYVVAHFHYVLFGGTAFAAMGATYYWFPKMTGRLLSERLGKWHFWLMVGGFNLTFFVQHFLGILGMPRRIFTYPDLPYWGLLNLLSTVGAMVMGGRVARLHRQFGFQPPPRQDCRRQPMGGVDARVGHDVPAAARQLRRGAAHSREEAVVGSRAPDSGRAGRVPRGAHSRQGRDRSLGLHRFRDSLLPHPHHHLRLLQLWPERLGSERFERARRRADGRLHGVPSGE
jgi:cytochrome c oxidase subunit I+III